MNRRLLLEILSTIGAGLGAGLWIASSQNPLRPRPLIHFVSASGGTHWAAGITALATAALAVGAIFAYGQFRETKSARHAEAASRMTSRWEAQEYVDARIAIGKFMDNQELRDAFIQFKKDSDDRLYPLLRELNFLEELGALEKMGATSLQWIEETMKDQVLDRWQLWRPTIEALNEGKKGNNRVYKNFELLQKKLREQDD
jgi:hypothetical protein